MQKKREADGLALRYLVLDWQHVEYVHQMIVDGLVFLDGGVEGYVYDLVVADTNHYIALAIE